ncbi:MAG: FecR domain-containing protein [Prolixibacteraceae bacterium]
MESKEENIDLLLEKIISGDLSDSQRLRLYSCIESTFHDEKLNEFMEKHWKELGMESSNEDEQDLKETKKRIMKIVRGGKTKVPEQTKKTPVHRMNYIVRAAAILTIPLMIFSGYMYFRLNEQSLFYAEETVMQQVIATPGSRVHFVLPDQSEVWLNSGSSLEFSNGLMKQQQRRVKLKGQGYFLVTRDERHPFVVETGDLNIKVLGTSFDVSNYVEDEFVSSALEDGAVALLNPSGDKEIASLKPGQQALFRKKTRELTVYQVDTRLLTSWKDGKLIFRNAPLKEVAKQLERWFNCTIQVDPGLLHSGILYTATIQDETLGEVLQMIEISSQVKTKIRNREVSIWSE